MGSRDVVGYLTVAESFGVYHEGVVGAQKIAFLKMLLGPETWAP